MFMFLIAVVVGIILFKLGVLSVLVSVLSLSLITDALQLKSAVPWR